MGTGIKFKYLEIVEKTSREVVKRMDVSDQSWRAIDKIERGMNINLNHKLYHTSQASSDTELEIIK